MASQAKLLAVNLKHFYQLSIKIVGLISFLFLAACFFVVPLERTAEGLPAFNCMTVNVWLSILISNVILGAISGIVIRSVSIQTFTISLPGYKWLPAKIITVIGLAINLGFAMMIAIWAGRFFINMVFVLALGMFVYLNIAAYCLQSFNVIIFLGSASVAVVCGIVAGHYPAGTISNFVEANNLWLSGVLFVVCCVLVRNMDSMRIPKIEFTWVDRYTYNGFDGYIVYQRLERDCRLKFDVPGFLQLLISKCRNRSLKYAVAIAMTSIHFIVIDSWFMVLLLFVLIIACYIKISLSSVLFFMFIGLIVFTTCVLSSVESIDNPLPLTCGRKERVRGALLAGIIFSAVWAGLLALMVLASIVLSTFMPSFELPWWKGAVVTFEPIAARYIAVLFMVSISIFAANAMSEKYGYLLSFVIIFAAIGTVAVNRIWILLIPAVTLYAVLYPVLYWRFAKNDFEVKEFGYESTDEYYYE